MGDMAVVRFKHRKNLLRYVGGMPLNVLDMFYSSTPIFHFSNFFFITFIIAPKTNL